MFCKKGFKVTVLKSGAGYFLGTVCENNEPNCRISSKYAKTASEALALEADRQYGCIENEHCNEHQGCGLPENL